MFAWLGRIVYRYRFIVIGVMVALCLGGGIFGMSLGKHVTQSGFYDDASQSVKASKLADEVYGRDRTGHIVAIFRAPKGKTVTDPAWSKKIVAELNRFQKDHPKQVLGWVGYLRAPDSTSPAVQGMVTPDKKYTFVSIPLKGDDDDTILNNYKAVAPDLQKLDDGKVKLAGLEPVANALTGTIAKDQQRAEVLALPLVAVVLFFVFGGVIAAALPVMVGGLAIAGALGIMRCVALFGPVHYFAQPVVTLVGLGLAIDYGLFVVSRFREEIAEGYDTAAAVRRAVMTAGRTVTFSAVIIVASASGLLLFPQGFLRSLTYAMVASVMLSAVLSITVLPACLGVLGGHVDALGVRTLLRVPFLANWKVSRGYLNWLADLLQRTKTREEVEAGFWGKLVNRVMKRPLVFAVPIVIAMVVLIIPLGNLRLGGISEKYLPPGNPVRQAQEEFDKLFPGYRTEPLTLVIQTINHKPVTPRQIADVRNQAMAISGFTDPNHDPAQMWQERPYAPGASKNPSVRVIQNGLINRNDAAKKIRELRAITPPKGVTVWVGGTPALEQDSIHVLFAKLPLMLVILISTTTVLMFLAFGSVVLPVKAAVMSALTLGSTLGILTWIFVDGHFSTLLNFTPTPLTAPVIGLVIAVGYGLATDYEVFLVSRMVETRERGMSTAEAIRVGTATTGRIITAAALILAVVAGAFVFSDLVMMKYLAFGLIAALLLDATVVRMFLVPSVMKLLGDDCWWAPRWMKRLQTRIGLGEIHLPAERKLRPAVIPGVERSPVAARGSGGTAQRPPDNPSRPGAARAERPPARRPPMQTAPPGSGASITRRPAGGKEAAQPTTRFLRPENAAPNTPPATRGRPDTESPPGVPPAHGGDRDIESWLGELRNNPERGARPTDIRGPGSAGPVAPSEDQTRAMPVSANPDGNAAGRAPGSAPARPVSRAGADDPEPSTEKLRTCGRGDDSVEVESARPRRGGGLSAQDLLRREGWV
ncbi:MMPL family transporter [Mycobacterium sp. SM1]|uniref:MMPL family transporter n=1 Tax=Mycobacterium sp. SM1 TaxID=2816243 RepID=UPI001BCEC8E3|nr:MMPL family transporter [Mycobacterium sp. SM1]MBS4727827.1 MMPL family transporter [Mycobacterium sp. SM1]